MLRLLCVKWRSPENQCYDIKNLSSRTYDVHTYSVSEWQVNGHEASQWVNGKIEENEYDCKLQPITDSHSQLGGGFKHCLFSPLFREDSHFWLIFFGWVGSTTNQIRFSWIHEKIIWNLSGNVKTYLAFSRVWWRSLILMFPQRRDRDFWRNVTASASWRGKEMKGKHMARSKNKPRMKCGSIIAVTKWVFVQFEVDFKEIISRVCLMPPKWRKWNFTHD